MSTVRGFYLALASDTVFALSHEPSGARHSTGVLFCPPFGWDDVCSYRSRRTWAEALAGAGHLALRIDLPGTGDSAGTPADRERLGAWIDAVSCGAEWLRARGCPRVCAIGIGLGGLLAVSAAASGAAIDDFILWAVTARGRALVRELRAFTRLQAEADEDDPRDGLFAAGFAISAETVAALERLDLTACELPGATGRRILMLGRESLEPDPRLRSHLERSGAEVTIGGGAGYGPMMEDPRVAEAPRAVITRSIDWLAEPSAAPGSSSAEPFAAVRGRPAWPERPRLELPGLRETPLHFELAGRRVFGVLCEPTATPARPLCGVFSNAGGIRRIGPNRMWVELARRWAVRGVPSLRIDLRGLGDADGDEGAYARERAFYDDELLDQTLMTLDRLEALGLPPRFVLGGLCSGAYWAFRAAVADERVVAALPINLWAFHMTDELVDEREIDRARVLIRRRQSVEISAVRLALGALRTVPRAVRRRARRREAEALLDGLRERDVELLLQFSRDEPLLADLTRDGLMAALGRWPNLRVELIPGNDHTFRTAALQRHVHNRLDEALERSLAS